MFKRSLARSHIKPSRPKLKTLLPRLEILEDRLALAVRTWDGGALSNNWTNATNWASNIAPVAGDDLVFPANVSKKTADNNFPAGTLFNSITVAGGYTLKGARVELGAAGITSSGSSNIIKNDIDLGFFSPTARRFTVSAGSTLFIDGEIRGGTQLDKLGTGNLSFRNNNVYTSKTDIQAGQLFIEKDNGLGGLTNGTTIRSGAALVVNDQAVGVLRADEVITIDDGGLLRAINSVVLRGNLVSLGAASIKHEHDGVLIPGVTELQINGALSGGGAFNFLESAKGVVRLKSDIGNQHSGGTSVAGVVVLDVAGGQAIPGNLTIKNKGLVYLERKDQISDTATVTVQQGGVLDANGRDETIRRLEMNGGVLDGLPKLLTTTIADYLQLANISRAFLPNLLLSTFHTSDFFATSTSSTNSAKIIDVNVKLLSPVNNIEPRVQVANGPAAVDLTNEGSILFDNGTGTTRMTMFGGGTMDLNRRAASTVQIDSGTIKIFRSTIGLNFDGAMRTTNVVVNSTGTFATNAVLRSVTVNSGGTFVPGGLDTPGTTFILGDFIMNAGSTLKAEFNGILPNAADILNFVPQLGAAFTDQKQHDLINVLGSATVGGALLDPKFGPNVTPAQSFRFINLFNPFSSVQGTFFVPATTAPLQILPNGQRVAFNYTGGSGNDLVITRQNTPPMAPDLALSVDQIDEGGTVTATGRLVDPDTNDRLRLLVNWGDGTREAFQPGRSEFSLKHRYQQDGNFTARFEWLDQSGQGNSREFAITVNNVAPAVTLRTFRTTSSGVLLASGWLGDAGNDQYTATLDFGDGSPVRTRTFQHRHFFAVAHHYKSSGDYTVRLTLRDAQGAESVFERSVQVA